MNDRFAAQVRQHLLETADVRPADGQLASVVDGVAATTQRHPLTARLTWNPGRIGPLSSAAIRYGLIAVALALATVAGATLAGGARQASTVFEGTWITIDPADGSGMTLVVGPGQTPAVYFEDGYATGLACVNDAVKRFTARGTGEISDNRLVATFPEGGGCGLRTVGVHGFYDYDQRGDTLSDQDGVVWTRALGEQPETEAPETPAPSTSPEPPAPSTSPHRSPRPGEATFDSARNGISIDHPEGWQTKSTTEPWTGGELDFETPGADVIFDPTYGDRLFLAIASQPYGALSQDDWRNAGYEWLCPEGGAFGSWTVDGADAFVVACGSDQGAFIFTETRGYLIRLVVPSAEPALAETYDWAWLRRVLETVDLRPDDAVENSFAPPDATSGPDSTAAPDSTAGPDEPVALTTPRPDPDCIQFDAPGTYTAPVGSLSLTVAMPGTVAEPWIGDRAGFDVLRAACTDWSGTGWIDAGEVTLVDTNACAGGRVAVQTTAEAIAAVSVAKGIDVVEQTDVTIDGYTGTRFVINIHDVANACPDGQIPLVDGVNPVDQGVGFRLYLIDVDGTTLALGLFGYPDWDPAVRRDADGIIASMQIDP